MNAVPVARLKVTGSLKLPEARVLAEQLLDVLKERDVSIDATELEATDVSVLQVLLAGRTYAEGKGRSLSISYDTRGPMAALVAQIGLEGTFGNSAVPKRQ